MMGKRSNFEQERDFYPTPPEAVTPLLPHVEYGGDVLEPCAGDGSRHALEMHGLSCIEAIDIEPTHGDRHASRCVGLGPDNSSDFIITNPPGAESLARNDYSLRHIARRGSFRCQIGFIRGRQSRICLGCEKLSWGRVKWIKDSPTRERQLRLASFTTPSDEPRSFTGEGQ